MIDLRVPVNLPSSKPAVKGDSRFPSCLYHSSAPSGKLFRNEADFNAAVEGGWVDSPAKIVDAVDLAPVVLPPASVPSAPIVTPAEPVVEEVAAVMAETPAEFVPREFTAEELKSVHKESAGDVIDAVERSRDVSFAQFVLDVESANPVKPRPSVIQAAQARIAKLSK